MDKSYNEINHANIGGKINRSLNLLIEVKKKTLKWPFTAMEKRVIRVTDD